MTGIALFSVSLIPGCRPSGFLSSLPGSRLSGDWLVSCLLLLLLLIALFSLLASFIVFIGLYLWFLSFFALLASLAFLSYSLSVGVPSDSDSGVYHFGIIPIIPLGGS